MFDSDHYKNIARLLREEAARSGVPEHQAAKTISLGAYFETLAVDPYSEARDPRFG
jgi:hypothetical protein